MSEEYDKMKNEYINNENNKEKMEKNDAEIKNEDEKLIHTFNNLGNDRNDLVYF